MRRYDDRLFPSILIQSNELVFPCTPDDGLRAVFDHAA